MRKAFFFLVLLAVLPCRGTNRYEIDDGLYAMFTRGEKAIASDECLAIADSMMVAAQQIGDKKAECLALTIPMNHYSRKMNVAGLSKAAETLRECSRRNGYLQYYYYAYVRQARVSIILCRFAEAKELLERMRDEATDDQNYYGLANCYTSTGSLYYALSDYHQAIDFYDLAIDIFKTKTEYSCSDACLQTSFICVKAGDYKRALTYVDTALVYQNDLGTRLLAAERKGMAYFFLGQMEAFNKTYADLADCLRQTGGDTRGNTFYSPILKDIVDGRYADAEEKLAGGKNIDGQIRYMALRSLFERAGDYRKALVMQDSLAAFNQRRYEDGMSQNYAMMGAQLDNERLQMENAVMEAEHEKEQLEAHRRTIVIVIVSLIVVLAALSVLLFVRIRVSKRLRQQNVRLEEARRKAEQSEQMKTYFIQNMTHEIRTPLNAVIGFSQLLADPQMAEMISDDERVEYGALITGNAELLTQLVNDVLHMSDMQSGKLEVKKDWTECNALCNICLESTENRVTKGVRIYFTTELDDTYRLYTDPHRVQQILTHFLTNACKFTTEGEIHLHCSLSETAGAVSFSVTDTGPGIPPEKKEQIFERFTKLDDFKPGFGLGLTICRQIAELLDGRVYLDTSYTSGARFVFVHPITQNLS